MNLEQIGIAILDTISVSVRKKQTIIDGIDKLAVPGFIAHRIAYMSAATREALGEATGEWLTLECGIFSVDYDKLGASLSEIEVQEMQSEEIQRWITEGAPLKMIRDVMGLSQRRVNKEMSAVRIAMPDGPYANGRSAVDPSVVTHIAQRNKSTLNSMPAFAKLAREFEITLPEVWASYNSVSEPGSRGVAK